MSSAIEETTLPGDLPGVKLTSPKGTAEVYRHGAHVTSWKTETGGNLSTFHHLYHWHSYERYICQWTGN